MLTEAAYAEPKLRRLYPFTSHWTLGCSTTSHPFSSEFVGVSSPRGEGGYTIRDRAIGIALTQVATRAEAINVAVDRISAGLLQQPSEVPAQTPDLGTGRLGKGCDRAWPTAFIPGTPPTDRPTPAQRHALAALPPAGAPVYEDPATSGRQLPLDRAGFTMRLHEAAVGDTKRIADAARLFRSVADILSLRPVLIRRGLHLRVESGPLPGIDVP